MTNHVVAAAGALVSVAALAYAISHSTHVASVLASGLPFLAGATIAQTSGVKSELSALWLAIHGSDLSARKALCDRIEATEESVQTPELLAMLVGLVTPGIVFLLEKQHPWDLITAFAAILMYGWQSRRLTSLSRSVRDLQRASAELQREARERLAARESLAEAARGAAESRVASAV